MLSTTKLNVGHFCATGGNCLSQSTHEDVQQNLHFRGSEMMDVVQPTPELFKALLLFYDSQDTVSKQAVSSALIESSVQL